VSLHEPGSYVSHAKLPELGSGEVVSSGKGTIRIRFAAGERNFLIEAVERHLVGSDTAPPPATASKRGAKKTKAKLTMKT
jgi:Protein of unknown function (DUF3553)